MQAPAGPPTLLTTTTGWPGTGLSYRFPVTGGANGTRTYEQNAMRGIVRTLSYSDEDYLLTAGNTSYQYDVDGFLRTRTSGSQVTIYSYSTLGELLSVALPDGTLIEYVTDPLGRRIAKKINGNIVEKYLWKGRTKLLAIYDGTTIFSCGSCMRMPGCRWP